jgi:hypothetical protein
VAQLKRFTDIHSMDTLAQFLSDEANEYTRRILLETIRKHRGQDVLRRCTFNRFFVDFDFSKNEVTVLDDLLICEDVTLNLDSFEQALLAS